MHDEAETNEHQEGNIVANAKTVKVVDRQLRMRKQKVVSEAPTHQMVKRKGTSLKKTEAFLSPFHERVVDASCKIENKEKELYFWLIHKKPQYLEEVVFSYNTVNLRRAELLTLRSDMWLSTHVIDFFFPILDREHYFILCFDVRKSGGTVIDNSDERDDMDLRRNYGATPFILQKVFGNYLEAEGIKRNVRRMKCLRIKYCAAILTSNMNVHAVNIANDARSAYAMACAQKDTLLNELLKDV
ncbi:hypothetical protein C2S52_021360 [Perilla frutescens var. hirtella]|nr:hypothetical protein C2S52_021360 [Perilla frutescens var. hirtella]